MLRCTRLENVLGKVRWLWTLAYLFCTSWFVYQLVHILPNYFHPTLTNTEVKEVPLNSTDFPLDFKICFQPWLNETVLESYGYESSYHYGSGVFNDNDSHALVGWGGNQSVPVKDASKILHAAKYDWTTSQVLREFTIWPQSGWKDLNATLERMNWIDSCYFLNMDMIEKKHFIKMKTILMLFNERKLNKHNARVQLKLQGRNLAAHRDIEAHFFYHAGEVMTLEGFTRFRVKIKKRVFIEGEPGTTCRNYPNSDFESYRECDDKYMRRKVDEVAPGLNLTPVWMTRNLSKVTTKPVMVSLPFRAMSVLESLRTGVDEPDCQLPCETFSTDTKLTTSTKYQHSIGFGINFQQHVEVTTTRIIRPTLFSFLSDVGGSLGLWLGLGVLQVLQQLITIAQPIKKKFQIRSCYKTS